MKTLQSGPLHGAMHIRLILHCGPLCGVNMDGYMNTDLAQWSPAGSQCVIYWELGL